jgi:hypothetical protein
MGKKDDEGWLFLEQYRPKREVDLRKTGRYSLSEERMS